MVSSLGFFTPVRYVEPSGFLQRVKEGIDDYFYLGGRVAYVIPGHITEGSPGVVIREQEPTKIHRVILAAIKVISYATLVIPLLFLVVKATLRATSNYRVIATLPYVEEIPREAVAPPPLNGTSSSSLDTAQAVSEVALPQILSYTPTSAASVSTVSSLMNEFTAAWRVETGEFEFPENSFNLQQFIDLLNGHARRFHKENIDYKKHYGFIDKFDLDPSQNLKIYMRADLHGDLKSLIENLRSLQNEGLLDENFWCKPGVHLVFLGDYCDRGYYGTQILEMLMRLREENPQQVHLIRGNHEYSSINIQYCGNDKRLLNTLILEHEMNDVGFKALDAFYETMSLTTYFCVGHGEKREYVQCTHGLFELTMDPAPLIDAGGHEMYVAVPIQRKLSERICRIAEGSTRLKEAAKRIVELVEGVDRWEVDYTAYNWADVSHNTTSLRSLAYRRFLLNAFDIRHYLDLSSVHHRVEMIFRGHEHGFRHLLHEGKVIVTTLPVGMDSAGYKDRFDQSDRAYIITPHASVHQWQKRAILRPMGGDRTEEITHNHLLTSSDI